MTVYVTDEPPVINFSEQGSPVQSLSSSQQLKFSTLDRLPEPALTLRVEQPANPASGAEAQGVLAAAFPPPPSLAGLPGSSKGVKSPRGDKTAGMAGSGSVQVGNSGSYPIAYSTAPKDTYDISFHQRHTGRFVIVRT